MSERCYDVLRPSDVRAGLDGSTWGTTSQSRNDRPSEGLARARASRKEARPAEGITRALEASTAASTRSGSCSACASRRRRSRKITGVSPTALDNFIRSRGLTGAAPTRAYEPNIEWV